MSFASVQPGFLCGWFGKLIDAGKTRGRLSHEGLSESQIDHQHGPIDLNIIAQTPEEITLAIKAEVVNALRK